MEFSYHDGKILKYIYVNIQYYTFQNVKLEFSSLVYFFTTKGHGRTVRY
jgi:hypothetical protein